jgi:hypothetical protein
LEVAEDLVTKKALGQFFSGPKVAALLLALAKSEKAQSIIDPMCGTGDMLLACQKIYDHSVHLSGIEIDPDVYRYALSHLDAWQQLELINGNAFDAQTLRRLHPKGYDLIITNPPYIRHQTANNASYGLAASLNQQEIRANLEKFQSTLDTLSQEEKRLFAVIIRQYSGLADLAIPSWILCALMVKQGGKIAMVLPESWLSRDYALIVKYLLLRFFKLDYLVEDVNSAWFKPAQVKTILLVATRIPAKASLEDWFDESFIFTSVYQRATSDDSLVGNIPHSNDTAEAAFVQQIDQGTGETGYFETRRISLNSYAQQVREQAVMQKWFTLMEPAQQAVANLRREIKPLSNLSQWTFGISGHYCYLSDLGVSVGQGLRTGANSFFYLDFEQGDDQQITVFPDKRFNHLPFKADQTLFKITVRKQSELDNSYALSHFKPRGVALVLHDHALPEDMGQPIIRKSPAYQALPEPLASYIRTAAQTKNTDNSTGLLIPELSAVKTNARKWQKDKPAERPKFWYMLPAFAKRHTPDLFIPRVNGDTIVTRLNPNGQYLIDANFSTLWIEQPSSAYDNYALLALLNSTYSVVAMEEYGTVMGGGALKLEATQLKKIPFPVLKDNTIEKLKLLGKKLAGSLTFTAAIISEIDQVLLTGMNMQQPIDKGIKDLIAIRQHLLYKRKRQ